MCQVLLGEHIKADFLPGRKNTQMGILEVVNFPLPRKAMSTEPETDNTVSGSETFTNPNHVTAKVKHGIIGNNLFFLRPAVTWEYL